ncbi:peptide chain release factor 1 [Platysternon megacephalum]|uniref:Peptide chain release factor 1 n=1 Tax=Platysternon megacephalum TaxID=55544 RepID=A0A4D9DMG9_9SAUR|nr:peptide chain release factor 1 [Platysternon megacephalum]
MWCSAVCPSTAMIGMLLLWVFTDASAALSVISLQNPVRVFSGQTAVLPISLRFQNPAWEFYHVKWDFITGNRPVLVYMVDNCSGAPGSRERTCQHSLEQAGFYQQRVNVSFESASLVLKAVQPEDAGTYRIMVRSLDVSSTVLVNLTVEGNREEASSTVMEGKFAWKSLSTINTVRMVFACLVLCILALTVGEYIHGSGRNFTRREETLGPPETPDGGAPLVGAAQHVTVVPSTPASFQGQ